MRRLTLALVAALARGDAAFATGMTPVPTPTPAPAATALSPDEVLAQLTTKIAGRIRRGDRYMEGTCDAPKLDVANYAGLPVTSCTYTSMGTTARVLLLDAPADRVAAWILTACEDANASDLAACGKKLLAVVWRASQAQFPVSGFVIERQSDAVTGGDENTAYCILFRDGLTVGTKNWKSQAAQNGSCGDESVWDEKVLRTGSYARIASTTREEYANAGGTKPTAGVAYLQTIRELYVAAWNSERNELVSATAKARKAAGEIN